MIFNQIMKLATLFTFITVLNVVNIDNVLAKSVADSMESFWDNVGGTSSNASEASGYKLQGAGHYTGGSFVARSKIVNVNPVSITPPGIRAGCGGIDIYTGAFSHINTDQFVALMKAIPSNAIGFAFQLALETISPSIKGTMDQLQAIVDKINNMNINSCDVAQGLVGGGLAMAGKTEAYCKTTANSQGWATDYARAKSECGTGGKATGYINQADGVHGDQRPVNINIAWEVLKKSKFLSGSDKELAHFVQALTGTVIIKSPKNDNEGTETIYKNNIVVDNETIKALLDGGKITVLSCADNNKCLNPTRKSVNLTPKKSFKARISKSMQEMSSKIASGEKFEQEHIDLVNKTSLPIHKAMIVKQAYFGSTSIASNINSEYYSSLVALDVLYGYLDEILKQVEEQTKQVQNFDQDNIDNFRQGVEKVRKELAQYKINDQDSFEKSLKIIEGTRKIENALAAQMSNEMRSNLIWAAKF